ncbi:MAG: hypothetical protein ACRD50_09115 [Candidatus Acidiferrales bacterium]
MKKLLFPMLAIFVLLSGCGSGSGSHNTNPGIFVNPKSVSLGTSGKFQFKASVVNEANTAVTWEVNGTVGGSALTGTIDQNGNFTAPLNVPATNPVSVTAVSMADASLSASSQVTIVPVTLNGQYAFQFSGTNGSSGGIFLFAGSITTDGAGDITSGIEDELVANSNGAPSTHVALTLSGTYTIGADGRGVISMRNSRGELLNLAFVLETSGHGQIIWFNNQANGSGTLDLQTSPFTLASLEGNSYAFGIDGTDGRGFPFSIAGQFTVSKTGNISSGELDANDGSIFITLAQSITGSLGAPDSNGRGVLTFSLTGTAQTIGFEYYIISPAQIVLMETDNSNALVGSVAQQTSNNFTANALVGKFVVSLGGQDVFGLPIAEGGQFTAKVDGTISGFVDENSGAFGPTTTVALTGTSQNIAQNGRSTLTLNLPIGNGAPSTFTLYQASASQAFLLETDFTDFMSGPLLGQSGGPFNIASLTGNLGFQNSGISFGQNVILLPIDNSGQFLGTATGGISGNEDINPPGTNPFSIAINKSSNFQFDSTTGRSGTITIDTANGISTPIVIYFISPTRFVIVGTDPNQVTLGEGQSQPF